jgi:hypothetical protein
MSSATDTQHSESMPSPFVGALFGALAIGVATALVI